ncbi:shikimate O-hydroxycinnamoyltransferase-like [Chenopodium quinoa]|uniref:shikimate O-hydroxycinnamoyltransferase-like n=1 Tax=Chenopodium quinoa TaxID=63459 RepID=UPI000B790C82|nr:shikimate O-hydroxycinnamoyltransferase-like [Chenopodium quinoa]
MVRPAEETPKGSLWLSRLDMMIRAPYSHSDVVAVYSPKENKMGHKVFDAKLLKESLSKVLVPFYPIAGKLKMNDENGRFKIDCNAAGALFVDVETTHTLADLGAGFRKVRFPTTREFMFNFNKLYINNIKLQATLQPQKAQTYNLSTYEVLAGQVWRTTCKARGLTGDQDVKLYIHIDGRSRLKGPTLPQGYFGNVIFFTACIAKARDITCNPVWYSASKIHEALMKVQSTEYLRSAIDYLESQSDLDSIVRGAPHVTCPNLMINSWAKLPTDLADFGWGKPNLVAHGGIINEGQRFL